MNPNKLTITQIHEGLIKKEFSVLDLTKIYLERIDRLDKKIGAFLTISRDSALSQAKKIDKLIIEKKEIPILAGIPLAIKDNILVEGLKCTAGSKILENYFAPYDATCIKKLKEKGAIILGKTNLDEFAMGSSTENSAFFPTKNPLDLSRVPGGSSGGSAAAVAADFCSSALGSDTGGSIRQPASFCGIVGLKPTYGAVSRFGLIALASSLDQIGPLTKTVEDARIVFEAIRGRDEMDSTSVSPKPKTQNSKPQFKTQNLKIGIPKEYFIKGLDFEVEKVIKKAIKKIEELKIKIEQISLPHSQYGLACYYIIVPSEASSNLAKYDGIKYGYSKIQNPAPASGAGRGQKSKIKNLLDVYLYSRKEGLGPEVKRRIMLGTYALSAGYYESYYLRAQKVRNLIKKDFEKAFKIVDFILTPTCSTLPFKLGEKMTDPLAMYLSDIFTVPVNLAGLPAISLPGGKVKDLSVGLQIIGQPFQENEILEIAQIFERNCTQ